MQLICSMRYIGINQEDRADFFDQIYRWVNYQGLLEACVVGKLVEGEPVPPNLPNPTTLEPSKGRLCIKQIVEEKFQIGCKFQYDISLVAMFSLRTSLMPLFALSVELTAGHVTTVMALAHWSFSHSRCKGKDLRADSLAMLRLSQ